MIYLKAFTLALLFVLALPGVALCLACIYLAQRIIES